MMSTCSSTIDDLPNNVIDKILMCLPIKDAVRTSILSRKWRYNWAKLPQLIFDENFSKGLTEVQRLSEEKLLLVIYEVLLLHWAPIVKLTLSIDGLKGCNIDQIMLFLLRNGIEDFTLHIWRTESRKLPHHLFSCQQLRHLNLHCCLFQPPPTFRGFTNLTSLELREVTFAADVIGGFISSCPLLERLTLERFITPDCLEINAPNLKYLRIRGSFNYLCFKSTALLSTVSVTDPYVTEKNESLQVANSSNLIEVLDSLPCLENLEMGYIFFSKLLAAGSVPKRLPTTLNHLKYLCITNIFLMMMDEVSFALCMITSSPNLVKVIFQLYRQENDADDAKPLLDFFSAQEYSDVALNQSLEVQMLEVSGTRHEFEFIKFMLAKSPKLERMLIRPISGIDVNRGFNILKEMRRFQRASPKAELVYLDPK